MKTPLLYHYPIVLIPKIIRDFVKAHPIPSPTKFPKPTSPSLPPPPNQPTGWTLLVAWLCACAGAVAAKLAGADNQTFQIALFLCAGLGLGIVAYYFLSNRLTELSYQKSLEVYKRESEEYAKLEKEYLSALRAASRRHPEKLRLRNSKLCDLLKERTRQPCRISVKSLRQGISEESFRGELNKYFEDVRWGAEVEIPGSDKRFAADFLVIHPESYIHIDVEIDEPYTYIRGAIAPCHALNDEGERRRNRFFLEGGWVVVRFAEEQVVRYPKSCCKFIASVMAELTGDFSILQQLREVPDLPLVRQWTAKEAYRKARKKERYAYLQESGISLERSPLNEEEKDGEKWDARERHSTKNFRFKTKKRSKNFPKRKRK